MSRESPKKCWMLTYMPETEDENLHEWMAYQWESGLYTYMVGQAEKAPTTGKVHLQAFVVLGTKKRLNQMKEIDGRAHWEPMLKTPAVCKAYCTKKDTRLDGPWEFGELKGPGRPNTLRECTAMVKAGKTDHEIAMEMPELYTRHYKGLQALRVALKIQGPRRDWAPELWVLYGPSGSGKSRFAHEHWPNGYWKSFGDQWWDMYEGEETIVLDDFRPGFMTLTMAQHLLDRYPLQVPVKGGYVPITSKRIVITSNLHPRDWYEKDEHQTILRRVYDYAVGRFIYCPVGQPWVDVITGDPWEGMVPGSGFSGNTSGNPEPVECSDSIDRFVQNG